MRLTVATEEHVPALATFYRQVWDTAATVEGARRARGIAAKSNLVDPGVVPPVFLALQADRIIGHLGTIPARFWDGVSALPGYWLKGLMVLPEFRGGPIGYSVVREAVRLLPRTAAMAVTPPARRLFVALGFTDLGGLPNFVRVLRGGRVAARLDLEALGIERIPPVASRLLRWGQLTGLAGLGGALVGGALRLRAAAARVGARGFGSPPQGLPSVAELDRLWSEGRGSVRAAAVRDGAEFHYRYGEPAGAEAGRFRVVSITRAGRLAGIAVLREPRQDGDPRLAGIAVASVSDLWFDPADSSAGLSTLGAAEAEARRMGADAMLCSSAHHDLVGLLARQGYVHAGGNVHLLVRATSYAEAGAPAPLDQWWVSRGDARSDEVF